MLPRFLLRLRGDRTAPTAPDAATAAALPRPDPPVCVVGDVHGCAGLLDRLLDRIAAKAAAAGTGPARLVFAGDLIDRGPDSAAVLARVQGLVQAGFRGGPVVALMGNHERMMLDFLDAAAAEGAAEGAGPRWLANGGAATLASFGIAGAHAPMTPARLAALATALRAALPPGQEAWLRALPALWRSEDPAARLAVSHAGADPARAIEDQTEAALLWGHRDFRRRPRTDGLWILHGHVIQAQVRAERLGDAGRIGTDTGAFATGRLSAAWLDRGGMQVLEARADGGD